MTGSGSLSGPYRMEIALSVLNHLGLRLYSNTAAAVAEAVANAWDADAKTVRITIKDEAITIEDDGCGMALGDVNDKFLKVAYERRANAASDITPGGRLVMGRKGIGKLSLLSIAEEISVYTIHPGQPQESFKLDLDDIQAAIKSGGIYFPSPIDSVADLSQGTRLVLRRLKTKRLAMSATALRRRLSRRFSVLGEDFSVTINEVPITPEDRDEFENLQFLWPIGQPGVNGVSADSLDLLPEPLSGDVDPKKGWTVTGWIGTTRKPQDLKGRDDTTLNTVTVLARGRMIAEDILPAIKEARIIRHYLTGQIDADFLDDTDEADIATSDRQRIQEDDDRYQTVVRFATEQIKTIANRWTKYRVDAGKKKALLIPALLSWLETLPREIRPQAEQLLGKIQALDLDESTEQEDRKTLYRQAIYGFTQMQLRGRLDDFIESVNANDTDGARAIFSLLSDLEAALYADIVKTRLGVITTLEAHMAKRNTSERVFQEHLFKHLWLLDPAWERATQVEPIMEQSFAKQLGQASRGAAKRILRDAASQRFDIRYLTNYGEQIIVELKKANRTMSANDLYAQGEQYRNAMARVLSFQTNPEDSPPDPKSFHRQIRIVFVVGKPPLDSSGDPLSDVDLKEQLRPIQGRVVYYDQLVEYARKSYAEYINGQKTISRIDQILESLGESDVS